MPGPVIAIIDDDASMARAIAGLVRSLGFQADIYASAEAFLGARSRHDSQCVITDIHMPGLSGIQLKRQLTEEGCSVPVIMITGRAEIGLDDQAKACGAFCFLKKPFAAADLIACLERALEG